LFYYPKANVHPKKNPTHLPFFKSLFCFFSFPRDEIISHTPLDCDLCKNPNSNRAALKDPSLFKHPLGIQSLPKKFICSIKKRESKLTQIFFFKTIFFLCQSFSKLSLLKKAKIASNDIIALYYVLQLVGEMAFSIHFGGAQSNVDPVEMYKD